jgi:endonuclease/exonuclease/phosphatase (EEP) superfamily protein YafD
MATLTIRCKCGEQFHADESTVGRRIRCRRCGRQVEVAQPKRSSETPRKSAEAEPSRPRKTRESRDNTSHNKSTKATPRRPVVLMPRSLAAKVIAIACWAYLAVAVLVAAMLWGLGDKAMIGTVLLFMGRWVFLLPLVLLVPAALLYHRLMLAPLTLAALIVLGPVMGFRTGWRRMLPAPAGTHFRVVSFNTGTNEFIPQMVPTLLSQWKPQVVAFQECGEMLSTVVSLVPTWMPGWYHYEGSDLCLISRFPIKQSSVMDRSQLDRVKQSEVKEFGGAGYVVRFILETPQGPIRVANLHLETPRKGLEGLMEGDFRRLDMNTEIRDIESNLARTWVTEGTGPLLVLGDFNTPVESRIFQRHWGDLADAFSTAGTGFGMTKYNGWIRARIDHVLTSPEWHVDHVAVGSDQHSDHRPLIVDLTLQAK